MNYPVMPKPAVSSTHLSNRDLKDELVMKITEPFTVAAVGDLISPQPLDRATPRFQQLCDRIREADVGFANMESSLMDLRNFHHAVAGTAAPLKLGEAIKAMGISIMSRANNHTFDGGVMGMISTDEALDRLGIVHAGTGMNLQEARTARYLETAKGRVGIVSMFSLADVGHFGPNYAKTEATAQTGSIGGAPGVNPLHVTGYNVVSSEQLETLKAIANGTYGERKGATLPATDGAPERFRFYDEWFQAGADVGAIRYDMNPKDKREILESVRSGKIYSDFMIATIHSHQATRFDPGCPFPGMLEPKGVKEPKGLKEPIEHYAPDFLMELAHQCIDNGADMFISHGVHALAGVEVYKGKPIFYGLSNFIFQFGLQFGATYDVMANFDKKSELENPACHVAVLATTRFVDGRLVEIRLHPADLGGAQRPLSQMGIPMIPSPEVAQRILGDLQDYSKPYGTAIAIDGNIGVIRLG